MDPPFAHLVAPSFELVGDEAVAELGIVAMDVDDGVGQMGVVEVPPADRVGRPLVEGLGGEAQHRAGHRHGDPLAASSWTSGYIIWERVLGKVGGGPPKDLVFHLESAVLAAQLHHLGLLGRGRPSTVANAVNDGRLWGLHPHRSSRLCCPASERRKSTRPVIVFLSVVADTSSDLATLMEQIAQLTAEKSAARALLEEIGQDLVSFSAGVSEVATEASACTPGQTLAACLASQG